MSHISDRMPATPKLLLAACISAALMLAGCSDDKPEQAAAKPAAQAPAAAPKASAADAEKAKQEAQAKAEAEAQAQAKARAPKVTQLPAPGPAPELSKYLDIDQGNYPVLTFEALRGGPLALDVLKKNLISYGAYGLEVGPLLNNLQSEDRFLKRDANEKFDANIAQHVEKFKDSRYVRLEVAETMGLKLLDKYDFDRQGFAVLGETLFDNGDKRGWLSGQAPNHRLYFKNGQDFKFLSVPDEQMARLIESRVLQGALSGLRLAAYGYVDSLMEGPADKPNNVQEWRGLDIQVQRIELIDGKQKDRVLLTVDL